MPLDEDGNMSAEPPFHLLSPSVNCLHLEEAATAYISQLHLTLVEMDEERAEMISQNVSRTDRRFVAFEKEWAGVLAVVNAIAQVNTGAWERLNCKSLTPAP